MNGARARRSFVALGLVLSVAALALVASSLTPPAATGPAAAGFTGKLHRASSKPAPELAQPKLAELASQKLATPYENVRPMHIEVSEKEIADADKAEVASHQTRPKGAKLKKAPKVDVNNFMAKQTAHYVASAKCRAVATTCATPGDKTAICKVRTPPPLPPPCRPLLVFMLLLLLLLPCGC